MTQSTGRPVFLIVNDDGMDSPMLPLMEEKLSQIGTVRIAVPKEEQSWKGKAMTRFERIHAELLPDFDAEAYAVSGTPADCVNLAVHQLFPDPPDWIVSGINIGTNAGLGFILNSGTVGAALEGAILGIPAVAFSTFLRPGLFEQWNREKRLIGEEVNELLESITDRMTAMMTRLLASGLPAGALVLNVNFPGAVTADTPARWVPVENNRYGGLFRRDGDGYRHSSQVTLQNLGETVSDRSVLARGEISLTPLSLGGWLEIPAPGPAL